MAEKIEVDQETPEWGQQMQSKRVDSFDAICSKADMMSKEERKILNRIKECRRPICSVFAGLKIV